jgi:hypothetical protein
MYLAQEGVRICDQIFAYSKKWKQPINVSKTVAQLFYTQTKESKINREKTTLIISHTTFLILYEYSQFTHY